jgi:hypothetical protein
LFTVSATPLSFVLNWENASLCDTASLHKTLRITPAVAANGTDRISSPEKLVEQPSKLGGAAMAYYLVHRFGLKNKPLFRKEEFSMEPEAVSKAYSLLAADASGDFLIEDDNGKIIMTEQQIRNYCKTKKIS